MYKKILAGIVLGLASMSALASPCYKAMDDKKYTKALSLCRHDAKKGDVRAAYSMGLMYFYGDGVNKNYKKAQPYFEQSVYDIPDAAIKLGNIKQVECNYAEARMFYRWGAESGQPDGYALLGILYHLGYGVPQDDDKGYILDKKAAELGSELGKRNVAIRQKQLQQENHEQGNGNENIDAITHKIK